MTGKKKDNDYQARLFHDDLEYEENQNDRENLIRVRPLFIPRLNQKCSYGDVSMLTYQ